MDGWMDWEKRAATELATKDMNLNLRLIKKVNNKSHWCQHHKLIDHSRGVSWPFPRASAGGLAAPWALWSAVPNLSVWSYPMWHNWDSPFIAVVEVDVTSRTATCLGFYRHPFSVYCDVSLHSFSSGTQSLSSMKLLEMNEPLSGLSAVYSVGASCALGCLKFSARILKPLLRGQGQVETGFGGCQYLRRAGRDSAAR